MSMPTHRHKKVSRT